MKKIIIITLLCVSLSTKAFQKVDINHASAEQIALLPGVGDRLAQAIVSWRSKKGLFTQSQDLLLVPGMREKNYEKIKDFIIFLSVPKKNLLNKPLLSLDIKPIIDLKRLEDKVLEAMGLCYNVEKNTNERMRRAAMLPKISLLFDYDRGIDLSEKKNGENDTKLSRGGHDLGVGFRAAFDLSELIFHKSELENASLSLKRLEKREKIIERLHNLYFRYERLQRSAQKPQSEENIEKIQAEMKEIAAALDAMSNHAFTKLSDLL
jgi:competence protein ComEA